MPKRAGARAAAGAAIATQPVAATPTAPNAAVREGSILPSGVNAPTRLADVFRLLTMRAEVAVVWRIPGVEPVCRIRHQQQHDGGTARCRAVHLWCCRCPCATPARGDKDSRSDAVFQLCPRRLLDLFLLGAEAVDGPGNRAAGDFLLWRFQLVRVVKRVRIERVRFGTDRFGSSGYSSCVRAHQRV